MKCKGFFCEVLAWSLKYKKKRGYAAPPLFFVYAYLKITSERAFKGRFRVFGY